MDYIISPATIYWINFLDNIRNFIIVITAVSFVSIVAIAITALIVFLMEAYSLAEIKEQYKDKQPLIKVLFFSLLIPFILSIAIPSKQVMYEMCFASKLTYTNVGNVKEGLENILVKITESAIKVSKEGK